MQLIKSGNNQVEEGKSECSNGEENQQLASDEKYFRR